VGFNLENTHLKSNEKIKKLLVFASVAVGICVNMGKHHHKEVQKIKIKSMGINPIVFSEKDLIFSEKVSEIPAKGL